LKAHGTHPSSGIPPIACWNDRRLGRDAGVVDEDVEPTGRCHDVVDAGHGPVEVGQVTRPPVGGVAPLGQ